MADPVWLMPFNGYAAFGGVVFDLRGHDHRMFGLSRPDHSGGDVAGVEEADRAVEDVEGEGLGPVRGLHVVVDPEFACDERGNCGFTEEIVAVDAGVDDQTDAARSRLLRSRHAVAA